MKTLCAFHLEALCQVTEPKLGKTSRCSLPCPTLLRDLVKEPDFQAVTAQRNWKFQFLVWTALF